jgi:hypothetical protein
MRMSVVVVSMSLALLPNGARAAAKCEKLKSGVKRCEEIVKNAKPGLPDTKITHYVDARGEIYDWEGNFPRKTDAVYPVALVGGVMMILSPKSTKEERGALLERLIANAGRDDARHQLLGNYEWISTATAETMMFRASRLKK